MTTLEKASHSPRTASPWLARATTALALCAVLLLGSTATLAEESKFQAIDTIKAAAKTFLNGHRDIRGLANTTVKIGHLDARLTLPNCNTALEAFLPPGANVSGKTTIGVRCQGLRPWTLYVPASVTTVTTVLIANAPLRRGHLVGAEDIARQTKDIRSLNRAYLSKPQQVIGKVLKKNLANGALFTSAVLTEPHIIEKGQQVSLQAGSHGLKVNVTAIALNDGAVGEKIRVKNLSSGKVVGGTILVSGVVRAE
ncbi:MAG: flagellar basal body P-ring formation protein FlgA [Porticoccaceae bacterium]|nr:flagellar basal body P-ring formation protein FlgA [Porticoccaceae bacterium]